MSAEKIDAVLSWADDKPNFDTGFILSLQESYEQYGQLTDNQEAALDNIIYKFRVPV